MLVCRLTVPIDDFGDMIPLPRWLGSDPGRTRWALQATLALADAGPQIGWRGDMRHLPSVGSHHGSEPFLVIKQDTCGITFVVTATPASWLAGQAGSCLHVQPREIGSSTHPTEDDFRIASAGLPVSGCTRQTGEPPF